MANMDETNQKLELLKMARLLLNEEYINRRAEDHNAWLANCDDAWKTRRVKLPYPPFAPYPTEAQIVSKALTLYNFVNPVDAKNDTNEQPKLSEQEINIANKVKNAPKMPEVNNAPWTLYYDNPVEQFKEPEVSPTVIVEQPIKEVLIPEPITEVKEVYTQPPVLETIKKEEPKPPSNDDSPQTVTEETTSINSTMKNLIPNFWRSRQDNKGND
jgi:hypothetical protein